MAKNPLPSWFDLFFDFFFRSRAHLPDVFFVKRKKMAVNASFYAHSFTYYLCSLIYLTLTHHYFRSSQATDSRNVDFSHLYRRRRRKFNFCKRRRRQRYLPRLRRRVYLRQQTKNSTFCYWHCPTSWFLFSIQSIIPSHTFTAAISQNKTHCSTWHARKNSMCCRVQPQKTKKFWRYYTSFWEQLRNNRRLFQPKSHPPQTQFTKFPGLKAKGTTTQDIKRCGFRFRRPWPCASLVFGCLQLVFS